MSRLRAAGIAILAVSVAVSHPLPPPILAQSTTVEVRVVEALVPQTDASGGTWRSILGPLPEIRPYVLVTLNERPVLRTHTISGSHAPRWNLGVTLTEVWEGDEIVFQLLLAAREWPELAVAWSIGGVSVGTTLGQLSRWLESDIVVARISWSPSRETLSCDWEEIRMTLYDESGWEQGHLLGRARQDCQGTNPSADTRERPYLTTSTLPVPD